MKSSFDELYYHKYMPFEHVLSFLALHYLENKSFLGGSLKTSTAFDEFWLWEISDTVGQMVLLSAFEDFFPFEDWLGITFPIGFVSDDIFIDAAAMMNI